MFLMCVPIIQRTFLETWQGSTIFLNVTVFKICINPLNSLLYVFQQSNITPLICTAVNFVPLGKATCFNKIIITFHAQNDRSHCQESNFLIFLMSLSLIVSPQFAQLSPLLIPCTRHICWENSPQLYLLVSMLTSNFQVRVKEIIHKCIKRGERNSDRIIHMQRTLGKSMLYYVNSRDSHSNRKGRKA